MFHVEQFCETMDVSHETILWNKAKKEYKALKTQYMSGFEPTPNITVSECADRHRVLSGLSKVTGKYRTDVFPQNREIMDLLSVRSGKQEVCVMKPTQMGVTEIGNNFLLYIMMYVPGPSMFVAISEKLARDHSKTRIDPMIEASPELKERVVPMSKKIGGSTLIQKIFPGGLLDIVWAGSGTSFRSKPVRFMILDDIDGFDFSVGNEGSPIDLAYKRTDTFGALKKIFANSTPTDEGFSHIERLYAESDQRKYHIPCPECGHMQPLEWGGKDADFGLKWGFSDSGKIIDIQYQCRHCHKGFPEHSKNVFLSSGEWIAKKQCHERAGFHLTSLLSPLGYVSWSQIINEFLASRHSPMHLKVWKNTRMGEVDKIPGDQPDWKKLKDRPRNHEMFEVPVGCIALTAGIDTHDNRLDVVIQAWERDESSYIIWEGEIHGDPASEDVQNQLDQILGREYRRQDGREMRILCAGIDSGGHRTQEIYNYARLRPRIMACKGMSSRNKPVVSSPSKQDVMLDGRKLENGVELWPVGTDTAKELIYGRLGKKDGPGSYHFYRGISDEFFLQVTAEKLVTRWNKGFPIPEWHNVRENKENHKLDCLVYSLAAAYRIGVQMLPDPKKQPEKPQKTPTKKRPPKKKHRRPSMFGL